MEIPSQTVEITIPSQEVSVDIGYEIVTDSFTSTGANGFDVTLTAPTGKKIIGFGYSSSLIEDSAYDAVAVSAPSSDGTSWHFKTAPNTEGTSLTTYIICVNA